jgi:hypothetical protein
MDKLILEKEDFIGIPFNSLLASGSGRRLWATVIVDGNGAQVVFKVENLKKNSHIEIETNVLEKAIEKFNEL